jgi:carbamoyltransferase
VTAPVSTAENLVVGLSGATRNACVTICAPDRVIGICEQERVTRVRGAGFNRSGLPDEALDELLRRAGRRRADIAAYVSAEESARAASTSGPLDHHFGHACAAFFPSPFESATIVVCDHESPQISVWAGNGDAITRIEWPWEGVGFAEFYSRCGDVLGFKTGGKEQRFEALARVSPSKDDGRASRIVGGGPHGLRFADDWKSQLEQWAAGSPHDLAPVASALQTRMGDLLVEFLTEVKRHLPNSRHLCVGGSLFYNSFFNSRVRQSGVFETVFVPINPGNAGLSLGAALHSSGRARQSVSPFLGPSYSQDDIKPTLDNCKLTYSWEPDPIGVAVAALQKGLLVGWFDGGMEWGPRALGGRSIIASPFVPFVLDNLNTFLKQREPWRGYALSGTDSAVREHFDGPSSSPFMECDFTPKDPRRFEHALPRPAAGVRVQTVTEDAAPRFHTLLNAFGKVSGVPVLINTSFNGFLEPIVCSPRDAIRVFFGTGLDVLVMGQFVLTK